LQSSVTKRKGLRLPERLRIPLDTSLDERIPIEMQSRQVVDAPPLESLHGTDLFPPADNGGFDRDLGRSQSSAVSDVMRSIISSKTTGLKSQQSTPTSHAWGISGNAPWLYPWRDIVPVAARRHARSG
jgi:hypothetical protein